MILILLGTNDKKFDRLLSTIEKEIEKGNIKDKVVVQAGSTKYNSDKMEIFDLIPKKELTKLIKDAKFIITHGGVGSILESLENNKKVIAAARLKKYDEHTNDHQVQIVKEFSDRGYILELDDFDKLDEVLKKVKTFKPKKYESNNDNFVKLIDEYIEKTDNISWYNKYRYMLENGFSGVLFGTLFIILSFNINMSFILKMIVSFIICFISLLINKNFNIKNNKKNIVLKIITYIFIMILSLFIYNFYPVKENLSILISCLLIYIMSFIIFKFERK